MIKQSLKSLICILLVCCTLTAHAFTVKEGRHYKVIDDGPFAAEPGQAITVFEFFSYGCPACYNLEPTIKAWLADQGETIFFKKVPVVFHKGWLPLARAYYTAEALGLNDQVDPAMFKALHEENQSLYDEKSIAKIFVANGVKQNDFENAFLYSPLLDIQLQQGESLSREYHVVAVPTIVIGGKYKTDVGMVGGNTTKFLEILNYLIEKTKADQAAQS